MPGITDALISSANHLRSLEQSMGVIQKNVANASTPGYARRDMTGVERPSNGETIRVTSSRDEYAEHAVRRQLSSLGRFDQLHSMLRLVESGFGVGEDAAIPSGLSNLFNAFSSLSANPNDARLRQIVLDRAAQLARGFNGAARTLAETAGESRRQVTAAVESVNRIAAEIAVRWPERVKKLWIADAPGLWVEGTPLGDLFRLMQNREKLRELLFFDPTSVMASLVIKDQPDEQMMLYAYQAMTVLVGALAPG